MKKTKIVCTIGPATEIKTTLEKMIFAGLNVARLNMSHNTYTHHQMLIKNIREVSKKLNSPVAILQDLQGPRIRVGDVGKEGIQLNNNTIVNLVPENFKINLKDAELFVPVQFNELYKYLKPREMILIDDANISLEVLEIKNKSIKCKVKNGGLLKSHKGMNFPKSMITCPAVTKKDLEDVAFGIKHDVDFIALSFVKDADDVLNLRKKIWELERKFKKIQKKDFKKPEKRGKWGGIHTRIIAKIERKEAVKNFKEILEASDGIMIARGDLGIELPLEDVPMIQKKIIQLCNEAGKPVIVATQMLDSMTNSPIPTRAEVSDIANAILDGTDAIMLSGETATGKYPLNAVHVMKKVALEVESTKMENNKNHSVEKDSSVTESVGFAVKNIAKDISAKVIVCSTTSGFTARAISRYKPAVKLLAVTPFEKTWHQLNLSWGVKPYLIPYSHSINDLIKSIRKIVVQEKLAKKGENIVICSSYPFGYIGETNLIKVETI
ncbi:pyruvate kinase [Candidatus Parcubacteria bacterium]|nr:MAG: pyruvate kinase [Candidatus Parcubacteria bacterium]